MGLAAASSTLSLGAPKPLAALPASHPWQQSPELHIGLRTGFCGCLTTFSSWSSALLAQAVGGGGRPGGRWPQWLWGWTVGLYVALGSYAAGEHAARLLDDRLRPREERERARGNAAAARLAVEAAPSIGVPWSGVVASDGEQEDGGGGEGLLSSSFYNSGVDWASSSNAAARRRGGGTGAGGARRIWGSGGDEEAPPSATTPHSSFDAAARAAARKVASTGEVTLPLSAVARHHASRSIETLARRSAVLEQLTAMRREADSGAAAERRKRNQQQQQQQPGKVDEENEGDDKEAEAAEEAVREMAMAAAAVARAEAVAATDAFAAEARREEEEEEREEQQRDLEGGVSTSAAAAASPSIATHGAPSVASGSSEGGGGRLGRWRRQQQKKAPPTEEEEQANANAARAAAAASLSSRRSSAWRQPPPRALSPDPRTTKEVSFSLTTLAAKVRGEEEATTTTTATTSAAAALPSSSNSSSLPPSPSELLPPPLHDHRRHPLASRATSLLRRGYRSAARAAEGGSEAEANLSSYSFATRTNALAVFLALVLWISFLLLFILDESKGTSASRRGEWLAVVLAPVGCLIRWRLATLNYSLKGKWRFLPAGTLAANVGGCLVTFAVAAVLERKPPTGSVWAAAVAKALQVGVAGSLSTVSTLSAEVTAQLRRAPADARGYAYLGITWACAQAVGVVVYGSAVWSK